MPSDSAPLVQVTIGARDGEALVRIAGDVSVRSASVLEARLLPLSARWPHLVTLDLSELRCVSALGLGVLATFRHGVVRAGGRVRIMPALQPRVCEMLEATGLTTLFDLREP
jgi:anti-anti-sigma factor